MTESIVSQINVIHGHGMPRKEYNKAYSRSQHGLVTNIYGNQRANSRKRNHPLPDYDLDELRVWITSRENFEQLYGDWVESGFSKLLTPSCDRINDESPYTLDNLRLVTWQQNDVYGKERRSKSVIQITSKGDFVAKYKSINEAGITLSIDTSSISKCCHKKAKTAGGFCWQFEE